jgi:hypothetical protein
MWFYIMIVTLLLVLMWLTQVREEFIDMPQGLPSLESLPDPTVLLKQMRGLMAKYDKPEVWDGIIQRSDKDPGQLARMNLGINNTPE